MYKQLSGALALAAFLVGASSAPAQQDPAPQDPVDQIFAQLDANHDGKLTQAEFTAHPDLDVNAFTACDADSDKAVSKDEFKAKYGRQ
jgi:Ca2+-binding EF-hand superfamily protein